MQIVSATFLTDNVKIRPTISVIRCQRWIDIEATLRLQVEYNQLSMDVMHVEVCLLMSNQRL